MPTLKVWNGSEWEYLTGGAAILQQDAEPGTPVEGDLWIDTDAEPSGSSGLVAYLDSRGGSDAVTWSVVGGAAYADIDATNAAVTFTVPASGKVLITASAFADASGATDLWMNIRNGGSNVSGTDGLVTSLTGGNRFNFQAVLTGLTPAASYTAKLGWKGTAGAATSRIYTGPTYGSLIIAVAALP